MKLTYLGTSAAEGFPAPFCECETCAEARKRGGKNIRTRSHALLDDSIMFDFPPDAYTHILQNGIDMQKVNSIFITHCHEDHLYLHDLLLRRPDWLSFNTERKLRVWGNGRMLDILEQWREQPFVGEVEKSTLFLQAKPGQVIQAGEYAVLPMAADHSPYEECLIYLAEHRGQRLLYAHDTGWFPEKTWARLEGIKLDIVSLDCNHMFEDVRQNHMGLKACAEAKHKLKGMGCCHSGTVFVLNHFSHNGGACHEEFEEAAKNEGFLAAWDGMEITV